MTHNEQHLDRTEQNDPGQTPMDVTNKTQDPRSMKDPVKQQLEKSEGMNTPEQQEVLRKLREETKERGEE
jgi:hypothetical protein